MTDNSCNCIAVVSCAQATYGAYWSDHRVLDCKRRGEGRRYGNGVVAVYDCDGHNRQAATGRECDAAVLQYTV